MIEKLKDFETAYKFYFGLPKSKKDLTVVSYKYAYGKNRKQYFKVVLEDGIEYNLFPAYYGKNKTSFITPSKVERNQEFITQTPHPNQLTKQEAYDIYFLIIEKESECVSLSRKLRSKPSKYYSKVKGLDKSLLTGEYINATEYNYGNWTWTGSLAHHYVLKHRVKPSDEFLKFLGYK